MSKEDKNTQPEPQVVMTTRELTEAIAKAAAATSAANAGMTPDQLVAAIAAAVREATKPYEDPAVTEQRRRERQQLHDAEMQRIAQKAHEQSICPHTRKFGALTSYNLHGQFNADGVLRIVCGQCFKVFQPSEDPKEQQLYLFMQHQIDWDNIGYSRSPNGTA
jgi:hypothetical protein